MSHCRKCDQRTAPNRRLCKSCSREDRHDVTHYTREPLELEDGRSVGSWIRVGDTWHASVGFDGYVHEFGCGSEFDDFPAGSSSLDHYAIDPESICQGCREAIDPESVPHEWRDLEVFVSASELRADGGEPVHRVR